MNLIIDCSHFSGTDLDMEVVAYACNNYGFTYPDDYKELSSEEWQWLADEALEWMDGIARNSGYCYIIEDNSLYMDDYEELSV